MTCHCCAETALLSGHEPAELVGPVLHRELDGEIRHVCVECAREIDEALELDGVTCAKCDGTGIVEMRGLTPPSPHYTGPKYCDCAAGEARGR